jgi:outer membrane scaffolding protein for murein synthesis (MipA/OmpV family)
MTSRAWALCAVALSTPHQLQGQGLEFKDPDETERENRDGFELELGAGAFYRPDYKGSRAYKIRPLPWGSLSYRRGDRYIELSGPSLRANIIGGGRFEFGPTLGSEMGRDNDIDNLTVRSLGKIGSATMAGAFFKTDFDLGKGSGLQIGAEAQIDTGNTNKGKVAKFEIGYRRQMGGRWMAMTGVSTTWADKNYTQTYFGVTSAGAAASGLPVYAGKPGLENVEWSAGLFYRASERWSIIGFLNYQRLLDSAAKSPIVRQVGTANQLGFGLAIFRRF